MPAAGRWALQGVGAGTGRCSRSSPGLRAHTAVLWEDFLGQVTHEQYPSVHEELHVSSNIFEA